MQEEKLSRLREVVLNPTTEAEPEDSTSIAAPTEEEVADEAKTQGLTHIQLYAQYVQAAAELGGAPDDIAMALGAGFVEGTVTRVTLQGHFNSCKSPKTFTSSLERRKPVSSLSQRPLQ